METKISRTLNPTHPILVVMVGLQGSGKSYIAKILAETEYATNDQDAIVLSSDEYRLKYPTYDNSRIFNLIYQHMNEELEKGKNVIIDATNITIKDRQHIFQTLKVPCYKIAYIMNTTIEKCEQRLIERNKTSEQKVPVDILHKYHQRFQVPFPEEGFNKIILRRGLSKKEIIHNTEVFKKSVGFDQKTKWHYLTLDNHMDMVGDLVYDWVCDQEEAETPDYLQYKDEYDALAIASYQHDIGKLFTQTVDKNDPTQCHYYGHASVGTYWLLTNTCSDEEKNNELLLKVAFYVNNHMLPFDWQTDKTRKKYLKLFGSVKFSLLNVLNKMDKLASNHNLLQE